MNHSNSTIRYAVVNAKNEVVYNWNRLWTSSDGKSDRPVDLDVLRVNLLELGLSFSDVRVAFVGADLTSNRTRGRMFRGVVE